MAVVTKDRGLSLATPDGAEAWHRVYPHMARHSLGTWLNASGAGLKTIMAALGHKDAKSSIRYQAADIEVVRAASEQLGDLLEVGESSGNLSKNRRNSKL
jgi:integrase